jgi:hypothetical protein
MELPKELKDDIILYCKANKIDDIDGFTIKLVKQGLTVIKFGATPTANEKIVEKIIEKIVEVPIEKIVEKVVEVPVVMVDTEISDKLKEHIALVVKLREDLTKAVDMSDALRKELEEEKNKNNGKRDFYGEK